MSKENTSLNVLKVEIKNFKNIDYREVDFEGRSAIIVGPNDSNKSSIIQAICSPINSKMIPAEPIKQGEDKGEVILTIGGVLHGEEVTYRIGCYFSEQHKRGRIVLRNTEGNEVSAGKSNLSEIIGNISFDIMEFLRLAKTDSGKLSEAGVKKQIELIKSLMPRDVLIELYNLDMEKDKKYAERTEINRDIKYKKEHIEKNRLPLEEIEKYKEKLIASEVSKEIETARRKNDIHGKCKTYLEEKEKTKRTLKDEFFSLLVSASIKDDNSEIENKLISLVEEKLLQCENYIESNPLIDVESLNEKLDQISEHNNKYEKIQDTIQQEKELRELEVKAEKLTERLKQIDEKKVSIFSSAKLPVKGLTFTDEAVMYNGLPLTEEQHPTSTLIRIGLNIGMALNPNLRLLVIKDGSLLDEKTMKYVLKICEEKGYQLLIEMVRFKGGELSIEFIEK